MNPRMALDACRGDPGTVLMSAHSRSAKYWAYEPYLRLCNLRICLAAERGRHILKAEADTANSLKSARSRPMSTQVLRADNGASTSSLE